MPSGYTSVLYEGEQSLRDFLMYVGRGMGFAIMQRDDDPRTPVQEVEASDYHDRQILEAENKLASLAGIDDQTALNLAFEEYRDGVRLHEEAVERRRALIERYSNMLHQVEAWDPPEIIAGAKDLAIEQLKQSIDFDCTGDVYPQRPEKPTSGAAWLAKRREEARSEIHRHEKHRVEEIERTEERNRYIRAFLDSLPPATEAQERKDGQA